jgi:hypothetical protein
MVNNVAGGVASICYGVQIAINDQFVERLVVAADILGAPFLFQIACLKHEVKTDPTLGWEHIQRQVVPMIWQPLQVLNSPRINKFLPRQTNNNCI